MMTKKIAVIGSSGGNLFEQGGQNPEDLLGEICYQAQSAGIEVAFIQFIGTSISMDRIKDSDEACLWVKEEEKIHPVFHGPLNEVNAMAASYDERLSSLIKEEKIDGLFLVSCDPCGVNQKAIQSAGGKALPAVGTGGTSMAQAEQSGMNVLAVSGTTGTTNRTRAIAGLYAFAKAWHLTYRPAIGGRSDKEQLQGGNFFQHIRLRGILMASLPGFIAMALTLIISKIPGLGYFEGIFNAMVKALPVVVATIAARQLSGLGDVAIVAGTITGILSIKGGLIGGLLGGILAGFFVNRFLVLCLKWKFPATTANIVSGGISGLVAGLIIYLFLAPLAEMIGGGLRGLIDEALAVSPVLCGALAGLLIWPAIMGGMYHAAILPIILLEMEKTGSSFLGAIDMVGLVMVSAGITFAAVLYPRRRDDRTLAIPGLFINLVFGTFVEASYPFMLADPLVMAGAIISAGVGGILVGYYGVHGTAYVPSIAAPALSNHPLGFIISMLGAALCAAFITLLANFLSRKKASKPKQ